MPSVKEQERINSVIRKRGIAPSSARHVDCVRIHPTETYEHFMKKCEICWSIRELGQHFISEALISDHSKRMDVLDLIDDEDYEIETGMSKEKKYEGDVVVKV